MMFQIPSCHFTPDLPEPQLPPLPPQMTPPHPHYQLQETSSHSLPWSQVTSPDHLAHPHLASPHHPHPYFTSPHLVPQSHQQFPHQNPDPGFDGPTWVKAEQPSELSYLQRSYSCSHQNPTTDLLQVHPQDQNQFGAGVTQHRREVDHTHGLPYNTQSLFPCGVYDQATSFDPLQDPWGSLGSTLPQAECSSLGSLSAEDSIRTQFVHNSYHDGGAPQPFCSPDTPGPSPHYPNTPTVSSPGTPMYPREERLYFPSATSRQPSCDSYPLTSDPGPHQMNQNLLQDQSEQFQDQLSLLHVPTGRSGTCLPAQGRGSDVSSVAQPSGPLDGLGWKDERGAGGGRGGGGRGENLPDWNWMKPPPKKSSEAPDCRLLCVVCNREFMSLPALNGHMRSHSGSRSDAWLNKVEDSSVQAQRSVAMVMPVTVPIRPKATQKACRSRRGGCGGRVSPAVGSATLYCSLLHVEEEELVAKGDVDARGDGVRCAHYTPPPMLCPVRPGPGLYCLLVSRRQQRVQTVQLHNTQILADGRDDPVAMETASTTTQSHKPRINVGPAFQAEVPPLREKRANAVSDSHHALLLWTPRDELEHPVNQHRVEALQTMACSSVVPAGGVSPEFALHVLSECRGDFLLAVEKLLSPPEASGSSCSAWRSPSVRWSAAERSVLLKSVQLHHKDFSRIQKAVQTKSVSQCVEFYYLWKKKLSLSARTPAGLTITLPDMNGPRLSKTTSCTRNQWTVTC